MWCKKRHSIIVKIVAFFLKPFLKVKYNFKVKKVKCFEEGSIILCNHVTTMDPFFVGNLFDKPVYYMASKDIFDKPFVGKLIKFLVNPIPKEKGNKGDLQAIKSCLRVAKENGNICIFPEGNRTLSGELGNIDISIVKLVKALKKPLILLNIEGGYGSDPRWSNKTRKGKLDIKIKKIYQYDEIKDIDNEELYKIIIENLTVNEFNSNVNFKGDNRANYLERVLYICPVCKKLHTIYTDGNFIYCKECGLKILYSEDLSLQTDNELFKFKYINEWYHYQLDWVKKQEFKEDELIYQDFIEVWEPQLHKKKLLIGKGKIYMYGSYFKFELDNNSFEFKFDEIDGITLVGKKKANIYVNKKTYQLFKDDKLNLLKYMHMFYNIKNKKEGNNNDFFGL